MCTGNLPPKFDSFFSVNNSIDSNNTKHASFFRLLFHRSNIRQFSISFLGPKFFNTPSSEIKNTPTLMSLQYELKDFNQQSLIFPFLFYFLVWSNFCITPNWRSYSILVLFNSFCFGRKPINLVWASWFLLGFLAIYIILTSIIKC